jgi:hypothetical protein
MVVLVLVLENVGWLEWGLDDKSITVGGMG